MSRTAVLTGVAPDNSFPVNEDIEGYGRGIFFHRYTVERAATGFTIGDGPYNFYSMIVHTLDLEQQAPAVGTRARTVTHSRKFPHYMWQFNLRNVFSLEDDAHDRDRIRFCKALMYYGDKIQHVTGQATRCRDILTVLADDLALFANVTCPNHSERRWGGIVNRKSRNGTSIDEVTLIKVVTSWFSVKAIKRNEQMYRRSKQVFPHLLQVLRISRARTCNAIAAQGTIRETKKSLRFQRRAEHTCQELKSHLADIDRITDYLRYRLDTDDVVVSLHNSKLVAASA